MRSAPKVRSSRSAKPRTPTAVRHAAAMPSGRQKKSNRIIADTPLDIFPKGDSLTAYRHALRNVEMDERIRLERDGVPYYVVTALGQGLHTSATDLQRLFRIPSATYKKKIAAKDFFAGAAGQSVVETMDLINTVEALIDPRNAEAKDFDAEKWVGEWIRQPQPALGGRSPADIMDTPTGREQVVKVLGAIASGAYL